MIDWERIAALRAELGGADFAEVVAIFLDEVEEVLARLRGHTAVQPLADDLHFLRGSALNLGFSAFGTLCQEAERTIARGPATTVDVQALLDCFADSKAFLLAETGAAAAKHTV